MEDRPYDQRPAARPSALDHVTPETSGTGDPQVTKRRTAAGWVSVVLIVVLTIGGIIFLTGQGGNRDSDSLLNSCRSAVAEWSSSAIAEVTGQLRDETGTRLLYEGNFPGGDWACNGAKDSSEPYVVTVYDQDGPQNIVTNLP